MLKFKNTNDFSFVDEFKENEDGSVNWIYNDGTSIHSGYIKSGMTTTWSEQTGTEQVSTGFIDVQVGTDDETGEPIFEQQEQFEEQPVFTEMAFNVYDELIAAAERGEVVIEPLPQSQIDAIAAEQAKQALDAQKRAGQSINGHTVSLTEENQNGLAAVMQGALLAESAGSSIFPLNFNARTETGEVSIPFANKTDYEAFCLAFMQARQQFF